MALCWVLTYLNSETFEKPGLAEAGDRKVCLLALASAARVLKLNTFLVESNSQQFIDDGSGYLLTELSFMAHVS